MVQIEAFQKDTLSDLSKGHMFIGNDPHYSRRKMRALNIDLEKGRVLVSFVGTSDTKYLDLRAVLRGFDCQEYVWC